ncbi:MAG: hypothetical protein IJ643_03570 [Eubacterium sp.]|nr:hypothetical protein [Eubacterium sp.]
MTISFEITKLQDFEFWSGAKDTVSKIFEAGKSEEALALVEEVFPDGCSATMLNDMFWFDSDFLFEELGIEAK